MLAKLKSDKPYVEMKQTNEKHAILLPDSWYQATCFQGLVDRSRIWRWPMFCVPSLSQWRSNESPVDLFSLQQAAAFTGGWNPCRTQRCFCHHCFCEIFPTKGNFKQKYITTRICSQDRLKSKFIQHLTHSFCIDCCCLTWRFEPGDREKMPESPRCLGFYILCPKKTGGVTGWLRSGKN